MVCKNAQTGTSHTEKDCGFTLIGVPFCAQYINDLGCFVFEFMWGSGKYIRIKLNPGTVLYYNGFGIMHRQLSLEDGAQTHKDFNFWNIACYANSSFYSKVMASFGRLINF